MRVFVVKVIEERCFVVRNGEDIFKDVLEYIFREVMENFYLDIEDLVDNFLIIFVVGIVNYFF